MVSLNPMLFPRAVEMTCDSLSLLYDLSHRQVGTYGGQVVPMVLRKISYNGREVTAKLTIHF